MAVKKANQETKLLLKVQTGTNESGKPAYSQRSIAHINPAISDDDAAAIGNGLGALQTYEVAAVARQDQAALVNEG